MSHDRASWRFAFLSLSFIHATGRLFSVLLVTQHCSGGVWHYSGSRGYGLQIQQMRSRVLALPSASCEPSDSAPLPANPFPEEEGKEGRRLSVFVLYCLSLFWLL